ncbi:hypothetical protein [Vibrionaceae]|uniref:hypothetical protein n=1 Tax=Vibrionaceae TaxID=641 RepID=UPI000D172CAD|nr:hypothetical protein [Vibrionaceae]MUH98167.1 hypothetical protein [Aliivibrio fischeri]MUI65967.1 hypothetical protein [Aliivibrio fischeri]PSW32344.1 hypothetical protein CTM70_19445 [Photobacterium phosphoreum]TDM51405.1 hypothetical protein VFFQA001_14865 [Aliivibrio fischeri]USR97163.1 hypothetical protein AVFI_18450 [Aliivibrio fischeri ATCC 7744 = JCM 18803 = DSM 507]
MEMMISIKEWLGANHEWFLSGIGVVGISLIWKFFFKGSDSGQQQKSGKNSTNNMAGRDLKIGKTDD